MNIFDWFDLQLFGGEGAGAGAGASGGASSGEGGGQASGESATVAAEQRLRELGVPAERARKRASKIATTMAPAKVENVDKAEVVPATTTNNETPTEEVVEEVAPKRMTWDEIMKDPEYNKEMQKTISSRLKASKTAEESLQKMTPAIELMARKYGLDAKNMDYEALANAINNDDAYYEQKAIEMGTSVETAKRVDQMERDEARRKEAEQRSIQEQKMRAHFIKLEQQSEEVKKLFPNFDLRTELQNPAFARMVSPDSPFSVEDAYHAVHRKEIQAASMQLVAQKTAEKITNSIQAGQRRPDELGASGQAPSVSTFDYRNASVEQRNALKKRIREAAARGEKLYPQ